MMDVRVLFKNILAGKFGFHGFEHFGQLVVINIEREREGFRRGYEMREGEGVRKSV